MKNVSIKYLDIDRKIWEEELDNFIPKTIYDMHCHIWCEKHKGTNREITSPLRYEIGIEGLFKIYKIIFPSREMSLLILGTPIKNMDVKSHNQWLSKEISKFMNASGAMLVTPKMTQQYIAESIKKHKFIGLKPYRIFASDPDNASILDFLPEHIIEVANHFGLLIILHLSGKLGCAERSNLQLLEEMINKYPRVQWILAHCARSFNSIFLTKAIDTLRNLPNIWYDTAGVTDLYSHVLLLKYENIKRILFGSDNFSVGCMRGKYISYAYAWQFYNPNLNLNHCIPFPTFVVYEQLICQKRAVEIAELSRSQVQDIFANNAKCLLEKIKI